MRINTKQQTKGLYMKSDIKLSKVASLALSPLGETIDKELKEEGYGMFLTNQEHAKLIDKKIRTVDNYISKGHGCPDYVKLTNAKNAPVLFCRRLISKFLSEQIIQTV